MVELNVNNNNDPMMIPLDYKADVTGISNAFRAACDDDTRNVMNVMANQTTDSLESLKFFVVTKSWFLKAWPILMAKPSEYNDVLNEYGGENWKEYIGRIQNAELVLVDNNTLIEPSESDRPIEMTNADDEKDVNKGGEQFKINDKSNHIDHNSNNGSRNRDVNSLSAADKSKLNVDQFHRRMVENAQTRRKIKSGMIHTRDYFFLGPSSWLLVKEKFGYDGYEICRCCKKVISSQETAGQWIEVALLPEEKNNNHAMPTSAFNSNQEDVANRLTSTILPPSGRFPYEKVITATDNNDKVIEMKTIDREEEIDNVISWSDGGNQKEEKDDVEEDNDPTRHVVCLAPPPTTTTRTGDRSSLSLPLSMMSSQSSSSLPVSVVDTTAMVRTTTPTNDSPSMPAPPSSQSQPHPPPQSQSHPPHTLPRPRRRNSTRRVAEEEEIVLFDAIGAAVANYVTVASTTIRTSVRDSATHALTGLIYRASIGVTLLGVSVGAYGLLSGTYTMESSSTSTLQVVQTTVRSIFTSVMGGMGMGTSSSSPNNGSSSNSSSSRMMMPSSTVVLGATLLSGATALVLGVYSNFTTQTQQQQEQQQEPSSSTEEEKKNDEMKKKKRKNDDEGQQR